MDVASATSILGEGTCWNWESVVGRSFLAKEPARIEQWSTHPACANLVTGKERRSTLFGWFSYYWWWFAIVLLVQQRLRGMFWDCTSWGAMLPTLWPSQMIWPWTVVSQPQNLNMVGFQSSWKVTLAMPVGPWSPLVGMFTNQGRHSLRKSSWS